MKYRYTYGDEFLITYIRREHPEVNYDSLVAFIRSNQKENPSLTTEELTDLYTSGERKVYIRHRHNKQSLVDICKENAYNYTSLIQTIYRLSINPKYKHLKDYELTDLGIKEYVRKNKDQIKNRQIEIAFDELNSLDNDDIISFANICSKLGLTITNVSDVVKSGLPFKRAISVLWFFYDRVDDNGNKIISPERLKEIMLQVKVLHIDFKCTDLYETYAIFKSGLGDSLDAFNSLLVNYIEKYVSLFLECLSISTDNKTLEDLKLKVYKKIIPLTISIYVDNDKHLKKYIDRQIEIIVLNELSEDYNSGKHKYQGVENIKKILKIGKNKK